MKSNTQSLVKIPVLTQEYSAESILFEYAVNKQLYEGHHIADFFKKIAQQCGFKIMLCFAQHNETLQEPRSDQANLLI
jgi:hypothetical protein